MGEGVLHLLLQPWDTREVAVVYTPCDHKPTTTILIIRYSFIWVGSFQNRDVLKMFRLSGLIEVHWGLSITALKHCLFNSLFPVRNNLTVFDMKIVRGHGAKELLRVGGKLPGPGASLRFNVPQSTLMECRDGELKLWISPHDGSRVTKDKWDWAPLLVTQRAAHQQAAVRHQKEFQGGECGRASPHGYVNEYKWI